ncbi:9376_t:CDS:1, partial [Scutellospora calospora]
KEKYFFTEINRLNSKVDYLNTESELLVKEVNSLTEWAFTKL